MNRKELFSRVAREINRQDVADLIPSWLSSAEYRLNALLRTREMVSLAVLPVNNNFFPAPDDFLEAESMAVATGTNEPVERSKSRGALLYTPPAEADAYPQKYRTSSPKWYTTRGAYFELVGWTATAGFQVQLFYFAKLSPLGSDADTTWLLRDAPHMYVNAILHFGFQSLEEYSTADRYLQMVAAEAAAMNERSLNNRYGSGPLIKQPAQKMGGRHS